jgi:hypothetical protein
MHDKAVIGIPCKHIRYYLAESTREKALIHIPDGLVYIFLAGGNSTLKVSRSVTHLA